MLVLKTSEFVSLYFTVRGREWRVRPQVEFKLGVVEGGKGEPERLPRVVSTVM